VHRPIRDIMHHVPSLCRPPRSKETPKGKAKPKGSTVESRLVCMKYGRWVRGAVPLGGVCGAGGGWLHEGASWHWHASAAHHTTTPG